MGREVKRVAANFDWPLDKVWSGFLNPFWEQSTECPASCEGGYSPEYLLLKRRWYGYAPFRPEERGSTPFTTAHPVVRWLAQSNVQRAPVHYIGRAAMLRTKYRPGISDSHRRKLLRELPRHAACIEAHRLCSLFNSQWSHHLNADDVAVLVEAGRLHDLTSYFVPGEGWKRNDPPNVPSPAEVNAWSLAGFGHDSINCWVVLEAELKRRGHDARCKVCGGNGRAWPSAEVKQAYKDWQEAEPPAGDWWQVWETVSEGSPVTPAFETRAELIDHLVAGGDAWDRKRGDGGWTRENAEKFVADEWAPTFVGVAGELRAARDGGIPAAECA